MVAEVLDEGHNLDKASMAHAVLAEHGAARIGVARATQDGHQVARRKVGERHFVFAARWNHDEPRECQVAEHGRAVAAVEQHKGHGRAAGTQQRGQPRGAQPWLAVAELQQGRRMVLTRRIAVTPERHEQQPRAVHQRQRCQHRQQLVSPLNAAQHQRVQMLALVEKSNRPPARPRANHSLAPVTR